MSSLFSISLSMNKVSALLYLTALGRRTVVWVPDQKGTVTKCEFLNELKNMTYTLILIWMNISFYGASFLNFDYYSNKVLLANITS